MSLDWQAYGACTSAKDGIDRAVFFDGHRSDEAKAICAGCEVSTVCLYYTLMMEQPYNRYGVFGQSTPAQREAMNISEIQAASMYEEDVELWKRYKRQQLQGAN